MNDLTLVSTVELVDELSRRFDVLVVSAVRVHPSSLDVFTKHKGDLVGCLGAAEVLKHHILKNTDDCEPVGL